MQKSRFRTSITVAFFLCSVREHDISLDKTPSKFWKLVQLILYNVRFISLIIPQAVIGSLDFRSYCPSVLLLLYFISIYYFRLEWHQTVLENTLSMRTYSSCSALCVREEQNNTQILKLDLNTEKWHKEITLVHLTPPDPPPHSHWHRIRWQQVPDRRRWSWWRNGTLVAMPGSQKGSSSCFQSGTCSTCVQGSCWGSWETALFLCRRQWSSHTLPTSVTRRKYVQQVAN